MFSLSDVCFSVFQVDICVFSSLYCWRPAMAQQLMAWQGEATSRVLLNCRANLFHALRLADEM